MEVAIFVLVVVRVSLKWGGGDGRVGVFAARHQNLERARGSFPAASRLHLHASVATFYQREHHRSISISLDHDPLGSEMSVSLDASSRATHGGWDMHRRGADLFEQLDDRITII
jgi:hypothetical protein